MVHHSFIPLLLSVLYFLSVFSIRLPNLSHDKPTKGLVFGAHRGDSKVKFDPRRATQLSWRPRAFLYKGFLSEKECDHLINLAKGNLVKSLVADQKTGKSIASEFRTSSGMFLDKAQDEVVSDIETRIAKWTFLPIENGEYIQILHYEHGQKYEPHHDYFLDEFNQMFGGHRVATVLMYLSNVQKGGETIFPDSEAMLSQLKDDSWSECAQRAYAVKPKKGDALLFFGLHVNTTIDPKSLHGSCPVIEGEKWSATKWIHVSEFEDPTLGKDNIVKCENENCTEWSNVG